MAAANYNNNNRRQSEKPVGQPRRQIRNIERMDNYQRRRNPLGGENSWAQDYDREQRYETARSAPPAPPRNRPPPRLRRQPVFNRQEQANVEPPPQDGDLYNLNEFRGTTPLVRLRTQNLEHSSFGILIDSSYNDLIALDSRVTRTMPFCIYQHYCVTLLNLKLLVGSIDDNHIEINPGEGDPKLLLPEEFIIPEVISTYLKNISPGTTPQGFTLKVNHPRAAQLRLPVIENGIQILPCGTFGRVSAQTHNAYECYFSTFISKSYIDRTVLVNTNRVGYDEVWNPFQVGTFPNNCVPNENLLGWHYPWRIHPDALGLLVRLSTHYETDDNLRGRLNFNAPLMEACATIIHGMRIKKSFGIPDSVQNESIVGYFENSNHLPANRRLSNVGAPICSPVTLSSNNTSKIGLMGFKRRRTINAKGMCYTTVGGAAPPGWNDTINDNFDMLETYEPYLSGTDIPSIREALFTEQVPDQDRILMVSDWVLRKFRAT